MGEPESPTQAFKALLKRYALQRSRGAFPSGMFRHALQMEWVGVNTPRKKLDPPSHPPLSDYELSALVGKPVFDIRIKPTPNTPKNVNWVLSAKGAREHWVVVKKELQNRMGMDMWKKLNRPRELRESHGTGLAAYSFALDMTEDPHFPAMPSLHSDHPLHGYKLEVDWPRKHSSRRVSDISVIRIHPTNFGPKQLWEHLTSLPFARLNNLQMPKQDDTYMMLQKHELGHARQPYPDVCPHNEAYYGEYDADWFMRGATIRLGIHPGNLDAFQAARAITSIGWTNAFGPSAWSCHSVTPAIYFGGFEAWPLQRVNALRRQVRAFTDLMLVGEDCNLTAQEIQAFTTKDDKFFKQFDNRKSEVSRQLARARMAEAKVDKKPTLKVERRLLALKKIWNDRNIKLDKDMIFMVGHTLEAASLFWPDLKDPATKLTPAKCAPFRPRKRPAPAA